MGTARDRRHQAILDALQQGNSVTVGELGAALQVAEMTIRRDLEALEGAGIVTRFHGGARLTAGSSYEPPLAVRELRHPLQKRAIAARVADQIQDGETVILDGGTTGIAIAQALVHRHVTVCPLSLRVAWVFEQSSTVQLALPPGRARIGELSLSGPDTAAHLQRHHYDRYVMTASGFSAEHGFTEWNTDDAAVKRTALERSATVTAAVDASKYGQVAHVQICAVSLPDELVVDDALTEDQRTMLERAGAHLLAST